MAGDATHVLEELAVRDPPLELVVVEELVLATVDLPCGADRGWWPRRSLRWQARPPTKPWISVPLPAPDGPVTTSTAGIRTASTTCC